MEQVVVHVTVNPETMIRLHDILTHTRTRDCIDKGQ